MRTTAFITLAIASLLLSTSADARVINERRGIVNGDGGPGGNGGDGGDGGTGAPGGNGAPGGPGGDGGSTSFNTPALPAPALPAPTLPVPTTPDPTALLASLPVGALSSLPLGLGGPKPDKRSLPVRRRLVARSGAQGAGEEKQAKPANNILNPLPVAGPIIGAPVGVNKYLPLGKRVTSDI